MRREIFDAVVKCLEEEHWKSLWVETARGERELFTQIPKKSGGFLSMFEIREEKHEWVLDVFYEMIVPEHKRQEVVAFIAKTNDELTGGHFEMNKENGEVCYRTRIIRTDQPLTSGEIDHIVLNTLSTAKQYLPDFLTVVRADQLPKAATLPISESVR